MAKKKKNEDGAPRKKSMFTVLAGPMLLMLLFLPTTIVMFTMMLPTAIAALVDKNRPRALMITVGAANFSGAVSVWFELLRRGHSINSAKLLATDLDSLMASYGAALAGLLIYAIVVPMISTISSHAAEYEKNKIQKQQDQMVRTWGSDIKTSPDTAPKE